MFFVSFTKGPVGFPYVFIITCEVPTLIPVDGITLGDHRVFVLRGDQEVFDVAATFEVSLDPWGDSTLSLAERQLSQAGNSQASLVDSTLSSAESALL